MPLDSVRAGPGTLGDHLRRLEGTVIVADAETDADLVALAQAALTSPIAPLLVGSAGLAGAVAACLGFRGEPVSLPPAGRWLILAGSRHPATRRQVARARAAGLLVVSAPDADGGDRALAAKQLAAEARDLLDADAADRVVVTGGETAVALFEALGASRIDLVGAPGPGLALGYLAAPGRSALPVVTKAGGFGDDDLFVSLAKSATPDMSAPSSPQEAI
jgi:4-hydroxythreonine-4-phosphate dehydrogenase